MRVTAIIVFWQINRHYQNILLKTSQSSSYRKQCADLRQCLTAFRPTRSNIFFQIKNNFQKSEATIR